MERNKALFRDGILYSLTLPAGQGTNGVLDGFVIARYRLSPPKWLLRES